MKYDYVLQNGRIEEKDKSLIFKGSKVASVDPITNEVNSLPLYTGILFPYELSGGRISFDIEFSEVCSLTRCGFTFGHSFVNGTIRYYQACIKNQFGFCSLDFYNGSAWEPLTVWGADNSIERAKKYSLELRITGNIVSFSINGVSLFTYTKLKREKGECGIFTYNESDSTISNLSIQIEKQTAFSIMKFEKDFDELYHDVIAPVCKDYGYNAIRADECYASSSIIQDIIREISDSSLIIADITMDNPNVFYELGYAHALSKPTILLADANKRDRLPFDISGFRTIFYENTIGGKKNIENELRKYIDNIQGIRNH